MRQRYNPFGGAERFVERALGALDSVNVSLIAREWPSGAEHAILRCNPFYVGRLWRDWGFARCVSRTIACGRFDLVQSHERIPGCSIYRAGDGVHATWLDLRARGQSAAARFANLGSQWHRYTLGAEARMFRHSALRAVICNSRMVRDDIKTRFGVAADKLHVIYNGIDLGLFHPKLRATYRAAVRQQLGLIDTVPVLLFVGSGFERKGVATLLDSLARMSQRDTQLLIVGLDRKRRDFEARAARLGLGQRVHFLGGQSDVRPFYGAADAVVLPTLYDPFPNVALEALASGLPLLTSTTCGAAELIRVDENGYVCDALDAASMAGWLDRLVQPGQALAMRAAARASVAALSLQAMAEQLTALYRALLETKQE